MAGDATPTTPAISRPDVSRWGLSTDARVSLAVAWRATWVSRLLVWVVGVGAFLIWGLMGRSTEFDPGAITSHFGSVGNALMAPAARWDTTWFATIADHGYGTDEARPAFFPLYPLAMRAAGLLTGDAVVAGLLVSLAAMVVALAALHRLTVLELGAPAARIAVWAVALFPMAFFLSAVYSESLFLAFAVGCVLAARTDRWALAGTLGGLAAATRSAGLLLVVALALLFWDARRRAAPADREAPAWPRALWIGLVPLGPALICLWFAARGLDGMAPFHAQDTWMRAFRGPFVGVWDGTVAAWDGARQLLSGSRTPVYFAPAGGDPFNVAWHNLLPFAFLVLTVPALVATFRRLPLAYGAYALAALALPLSYPVGPQPLMSYPRFVAVLFPLFMGAGAWAAAGPPWRTRVLLGASAAGLVACTAQFATWHWVA